MLLVAPQLLFASLFKEDKPLHAIGLEGDTHQRLLNKSKSFQLNTPNKKSSPPLSNMSAGNLAAVACPSPKLVGEYLVNQHKALLQSDIGVQRIHDAHRSINTSLLKVAPETILYTFGSSSVYGFHEPKSDVDFVALRVEDVRDGKGEDCTSQLAKALQTELLGKLARDLKTNNFSWQVEEVKRARVPVIRVKSATVDFDITAFRRNGVRNSALLRTYFEQNPMNRWLSMSIKAWSKQTGMNGPMGFITSYGFNIMVVYYLLHRQRQFVSAGMNDVPESLIPNAMLPQQLKFVDKNLCDVSQVSTIPTYLPLEAPVDSSVIGAQALDFLHFYLHRFPIDTHVITLSREEPLLKETLNWTRTMEDMRSISQEKVAYRLCIEDPYEINLNVGRNATSFKLDMMRRHFEKAWKTGFGAVP